MKIIIAGVFLIFIISLISAIRSAGRELGVPREVLDLKITGRKKVEGVILFLKGRVLHIKK